MQERLEALQLIVVDQPEVQRPDEARDAKHGEHHEIPEAHTRGDEHHRQQDAHDERGAEVGLLVDKQDRYRPHGQHHGDVAREHHLLASAVDRHDDDQGERRELRWLHLERADREPPLRAERRMTEVRQHGDERQDDEPVEHVGPLLQPVVVDQSHDDHDHEAHREPGQLPLQVVLGVAARVHLLDARRRVHHHGADQREQDGTADQDEVAMADQLPGRVTLLAMAPPSRHARGMNSHGSKG